MDHTDDERFDSAAPADEQEQEVATPADVPADTAPETAAEPTAGDEPAAGPAEPDPTPEATADPAEPVADVASAPAPADQPEPEAVPEPEPEVPDAAPEPVAEEVEPELAAAVDEALEGVEEAVEAEAAADAAADDEDDDEEDVLADWTPGEWYVVHTYAGYENKVKVDLETRVASMNMEDRIYEVVIPMEEVTEVKSGKKQKVQKKVFPGYLLVRLDLDDESWYVVRNTPGVTGFVGSGSKPTPLSEREVDKILQRGKPEEEAAERPKPKLAWAEDDPVRVTTGPFANFQGVISEVDGEREKVKVLVNIFGRETPVELNFDDIAKV